MPEFTRFAETITKKQDKRVVNITVKPTVTDCTGTVWFTDLMLQEGDKVTGFAINTGTLLKKYDGDDPTTGKRFYNGIVRSTATCIIYNLGSTAAGLDTKSIRFRQWLPGVFRSRWVKVPIKQLSKQRRLPVTSLTFSLLRGSA